MFYKVHNKISLQKIEENVGDFRLLSRQVIDEIFERHKCRVIKKISFITKNCRGLKKRFLMTSVVTHFSSLNYQREHGEK